MELSFLKEGAVDLVLRRESLRGFLTATVASRLLATKSFLALCLLKPELQWHRVRR
jgi:hypothetical protein